MAVVLALSILPTASGGGSVFAGELPIPDLPLPEPLPVDPPVNVTEIVEEATQDPASLVEDFAPAEVPWSGDAGVPEDVPVSLPLPDGGPSAAGEGSGILPSAISVATGLQVGTAVAAAVYVSEGLRWRDWRDAVPFAALFSRLRRERLLDHPVRKQIYEAIRARAGIHYRELLRTLGISNGTLAFHLHHLERAGYVRARRVRGRKHFYPTDLLPAADDVLVTERQRRILGYLRLAPGSSQAEITRATGLKRSNVSYHVGVLRSLGLIETRRVGSSTRCFARER